MLNIPFFKNTRDNRHCTQAVLKSILKYYFPKRDYSFRYLDRVTAHCPDKWTWMSATLLFLAKLYFRTTYIVNFDYRAFSHLGDKYLQREWTDEVYQAQRRNSDLPNERILAGKMVHERRIRLINRPATIQDLYKLWASGHILLVPINALTLERQKGYSPHIVTITNLTKSTVVFHDPGLPPHPNRRVSIELFLKAMQYPSKSSADIIAIKK